MEIECILNAGQPGYLVTAYLPTAVFEQYHHAHSIITVFDKVDQILVFGFLHVVAVDRQDDVPLAHTGPVRRAIVLDVVHVRDHLDLLLLLVVYAVALQREAVRAVLLLHDDRTPASVLVRLRGSYPVRLYLLQDL